MQGLQVVQLEVSLLVSLFRSAAAGMKLLLLRTAGMLMALLGTSVLGRCSDTIHAAA